MMTRFPSHLFFVPFFALSLLAGCSASTGEPPSGTGSAASSASASGGTEGGGCEAHPDPVCEHKACGVDCTPEGSDEPFACNAAGKCVTFAPEAPLGCKQCPEFLGDCAAGTLPADLDGDGCLDGCR